ncbi:MAG: hypothetical protein FRX49_07580 [Trebouxia sp. A1-2]|nr:MAG: hypothetical protein FRX49_07580 [Trebouxia sp. A1-2]
MASMRASSPVSLGGFGASGGELSSQSPKPYMTSDKATYTTATSSTLRGCSSANLNSPSHSPSQYAVPTGRSWQSPQTVKTPDHSAVARLKHELQDERRKLQAGVATDKAYARKLEAKLSASKSISDLHARCSQYKLKLRELAQELDEAESRTASVHEIADVRADEEGMSQLDVQHKAWNKTLQKHMIELSEPAVVKSRGFVHLVALGPISMRLLCVTVKAVELVDRMEMRKTDCFGKTRIVLHVGTLRQALQIKAELSKQAGADIHSRLLYAVAKSREEGLALAVQLAECKERIRQAENSADDAHDESRVLREQLDEAESQLQQMEQKLVDTAASCRGFEGNAEEIRSEVHAMQQQVRVLAGEKEDLHHQMHSEQQRSRQHLAQVATLEQQVANLERQRQQESASLRGSAEHMQREMQGHCTNLQAQLDAFQEMMERERQTASSSLARERARANAAEQAADSSSSQAEARRRQLQHDLDNAHSEVQTLNDVSQRLQSSLADTTKAHQAERLKRDNLHKQVLSLEASLSAVHNERSQSDMGLKSRMQELLSELQSTLQERGVYKAKWQQLLSQHTSSQSTVERLQKELQQLQASHADLQQVKRSLESRLLGHRPTTADHSHDRGSQVTSSRPARQPHADAWADPAGQKHRAAWSSPAGAAGNRAAQKPYPEDLSIGRTAAEQSSNWSGTSDLDRVLAEHQGRLSPGAGQAFEHSELPLSTEEAESESRSQLDGGVSSEEIMARLTKSPAAARFGKGPGDHHALALTQRQHPGDLARQSVAQQPFKRVSEGSGAGLQSPPYDDDRDNFDATLPTDELKSALFGPASNMRQQAQTPNQSAETPRVTFGRPPHAATAPAAPSGQLQQQVLQQLQSSDGQQAPGGPARPTGSADILAHHQQASDLFLGFSKSGQDVPHHARMWSIPVPSPKLTSEFSLTYSNPLAEQHSLGRSTMQMPSASVQSVHNNDYSKQGQFQVAEQHRQHVLSLTDLANMDPASL